MEAFSIDLSLCFSILEGNSGLRALAHLTPTPKICLLDLVEDMVSSIAGRTRLGLLIFYAEGYHHDLGKIKCLLLSPFGHIW